MADEVKLEINVDAAQLAVDVLWQLAKGALRAVVAAHGARLGRGSSHSEVETKYERLNDEVEQFISNVEYEELNV